MRAETKQFIHLPVGRGAPYKRAAEVNTEYGHPEKHGQACKVSLNKANIKRNIKVNLNKEKYLKINISDEQLARVQLQVLITIGFLAPTGAQGVKMSVLVSM